MLKSRLLRRSLGRAALVLALCALGLPLGAAVPGQVDFQGLLLDAGGQKVNGAVDLDFTLYDAPSGGSALWTESHADVQVSDGVYGVTLGATTPLDTSVLGAGDVYLEIVVEGETLTPRRQLLAVPYAIRAADADNVSGTSGVFFQEIVQHFPFDGAAPANDHPSEGTGDTDLDGLANFIDPDNDNDGVSDAVELAQSSDINLVTPTLTSFSPTEALLGVSNLITVNGTNFEAGISVSFGTDNPTPQSLTPTSFQVLVAPQFTTTPVTVTVTRLNGESASASYTFRGRKVFLAAPGTGAMGGIAGGDARCATAAASLGLTGTYLAWLGDSSTSPSVRFLHDAIPYERLDGTKIADDYADLTDGTLDNPISASGLGVWTGVLSDGTAATINHCSDWTSTGGSGLHGVANQTDNQWTQGVAQTCSLPFPVYCFEQ